MLSKRLFVYVPNKFNKFVVSGSANNFATNSNSKCFQNKEQIQNNLYQNISKRDLHQFSKTNGNLGIKKNLLYQNGLKITIVSHRFQSHQTKQQQQQQDEIQYGNQKVFDDRKKASKYVEPIEPYVDPKMSYAYGKSTDSLLYSTVSKELYHLVKQTGGKQLSMISDFEGIEKSLGEFQRDIDTIAKSLLTKFGLKRGDSVGIFSYNTYNWLVAQFACARSGLVLVPINPSYKAEELAYVLQSAQVKCLFTNGPKSVQNELNQHLELLKNPKIIAQLEKGEIKLANVILMDGTSEDYKDHLQSLNGSLTLGKTNALNVHDKIQLHHWSECMQNGRVYASLDDAKADLDKKQNNGNDELIVDLDSVSPDDLFAIYYTSGTTGTPKGACVSHFAALNNAKICFRRLIHGQADNWTPKMVTVLPFFHIFAGVLIGFGPQISPAVMVLPSYKYDIEATINSIIKHKTNVTSITPTILTDLLRYVKEKNLGKQIPLETVQSGGAALPPELVKRSFEVLENLNDVLIGYGSTENGGVATMQTIMEPKETKTISVGPPIDFSEIRVVNHETGELVELGQKGEIETRGHNVMRGYLNDPLKTEAVITQTRWYKTGDIGIMHPNGSVQIVGRLKSLIIRGGENIYPDEVERFIYKMPFVDTVYVIGIPDKRVGEQVCAWIKLKPGYCEAGKKVDPSHIEVTREEVIKFCTENMTYFKVPKYILFVDSFPLTPTKKAQNHLMSEMTIKMLGLSNDDA